jgi:hypothetical protein
MLAPLLEDPAALRRIVIARRTKRNETLGFRVSYIGFTMLFRLLTGVVVRSGNFAAYRGWVARQVLRHPHFDLCYSSTLVSLDLDTRPVPCERGVRFAGKSRMNFARLVMHALRMLMPFTDRIAIRALLALVGTVAMAAILALVVLSIRLFTDDAVPGWATTTLGLLLVLSTIAFGNLLVLFVVFSHSRGISLANLEAAYVSSDGVPAEQAEFG